MIRIDERATTATPSTVFRVAADVERWPEILPHYRWVRFRERKGFAHGVVEMAAWRDFAGPLRWPTWWLSAMESEPDVPLVRYRHIDGITRGMDVRWEFVPAVDGGTLARVVHEWDGPGWPLIGRIAADFVIGPHFVSAIAARTLAGVCAAAERAAATPTAQESHGNG
ncbi:MAG TPA: SRPBCC family protein [Longimicrobiales bacterium]|nr:SRPBCC family protein [Longimicrobiales bacterium]